MRRRSNRARRGRSRLTPLILLATWAIFGQEVSSGFHRVRIDVRKEEKTKKRIKDTRQKRKNVTLYTPLLPNPPRPGEKPRRDDEPRS